MCDINTWNLDVICEEKDKLHEYIKRACATLNYEYKFSFSKKRRSIIEEVVNQIYLFHQERLNFNKDEIFVTFWFKNKSNDCTNCKDFHFDHDFYQTITEKKSDIDTLITTITYFDDSIDPLLITNMKKNSDEVHDPQINCIYPKRNLHVSFDSNYYHSSGNIHTSSEHDRNAIVVCFWKKRYPLHVPKFSAKLCNYAIFHNFSIKICKPIDFKFNFIENNCKIALTSDYDNFALHDIVFNNDTKLENITNILDTIDDTNGIITISSKKEEDTNSKKLIVYQQNTICELEKQIQELNALMNKNDKNESSLLNNKKHDCLTSYFFKVHKISCDNKFYRDLTEYFNINHNKNHVHLFESNFKDEYNVYTVCVKKLFELCMCESGSSNKDNYIIESWLKSIDVFNNNHIHLDSDDISVKRRGISRRPIITCILYLNESEIPLVSTNISELKRTHNDYTDLNIDVAFPQKMHCVIFNGGNFYHFCNSTDVHSKNETRRAIVLNIWENYKPLDIPFYDFSEYDKYNKRNMNSSSEIEPIQMIDNNYDLTLQTCRKWFNDYNTNNNIFDLFSFNKNHCFYRISKPSNIYADKKQMMPFKFEEPSNDVLHISKFLSLTLNNEILKYINNTSIVELEKNVNLFTKFMTAYAQTIIDQIKSRFNVMHKAFNYKSIKVMNILKETTQIIESRYMGLIIINTDNNIINNMLCCHSNDLVVLDNYKYFNLSNDCVCVVIEINIIDL